MKKYLDYALLGCSVLFGALIFVFMALPGLKETVLGTSTNVYKLLGDAAGLIVAFVFIILAFLIAACLLVLKVLGKLDNNPLFSLCAVCGALLALVAVVLFFLAEPMASSGHTYEYVKLGAGSVLCALSSLVCALGLGCFAALRFLKK